MTIQNARCTGLALVLALTSSMVNAQDCNSLGGDGAFVDGFEPVAVVAPGFITAPLAASPTSDLPGLSSLPLSNLVIPTTPPQLPPTAGPLAPTIFAVVTGAWQSPATWGGRLPANCDIVAIPRGITVTLTGASANLNGLWIDGALRFGPADVQLTTRFAIVTGRLQAGTESEPYRQRAVITLFGTDRNLNVMGMGGKAIAVLGGGLLKMHGEPRLAWTRIAQSAAAGATSIQTADPALTWRPGDQLLLVASGYDPRQSQVVTVTGIVGNQVQFTPALQHPRVGLLQTYAGKVLDQRATVALLSRNILIQGSADSDANGFGGHIMSMLGAHTQLSGIELYRMGQRGIAARYPMHWHLAGDRQGNYLIAAAIHDSFQRAAVIHSTNHVTLDANVAFRVSNHAYVWAEDGDEHSNVLTRNVGALIRSPAPADFAFPINNPLHGNNSQDEHRSSVYWGRSFDRHVITGNLSAGALNGFGFFFDLFSPAPFGGDEGGGLVFTDNIAHSTFKTFATGNQINYPEATTGHGLMVSTGSSGNRDHVFRGYTGYHNVSGAWFEDRRMQLRDSILADNGVGLMVLRSRIEDSVIVGDSANPTPLQPTFPSVSTSLTAGIQVAGSNHGGKRAPVLRNLDIINQSGTGILWDLDNLSPASVFEDLRFTNTPQRIVIHHVINFEFSEPPTFGLADSDGSLFGNGQPTRLLRQDANLIDAACVASEDTAAYACPRTASLILRAGTALNLVEASGAITRLRTFDYFDAGMPAEGPVSLVGNGRVYRVAGPARSRHDFVLADAQGKSLELIFNAPAAPGSIVQAGTALSAAASLAALRSAAQSGYFRDGATGQLHVRVIATAAEQSLAVVAATLATAISGRARIALPAGAINGFTHRAAAAGITRPRLRYAQPPEPPLRAGLASAALIDAASSAPPLAPAANGEATGFSFYVNAPVSGAYRIGLWGNGGGTSVWVGDTFVMGERWAFINSNWVGSSGQLTTQVVPWQVNGMIALEAGWHLVHVVHGRFPQNNQGRNLYFRWATPNNPGTWVYPSVWRAP